MKYAVSTFTSFFPHCSYSCKIRVGKRCGVNNISSRECLEVLEKGNVVNSSGENYCGIVLKGHPYIVTV